jgi:hypothetical protein
MEDDELLGSGDVARLAGRSREWVTHPKNDALFQPRKTATGRRVYSASHVKAVLLGFEAKRGQGGR